MRQLSLHGPTTIRLSLPGPRSSQAWEEAFLSTCYTLRPLRHFSKTLSSSFRMSSSRGIALNCGLAAPPTTTTCHTPNTPEILNAIVNISFPTPSMPSQASTPFPPSSLSFPPVVAPQAAPLPSPSYSDCSTPSSSTSGASPLNSPTGQNSVQHIQSQFIKEGLKMKVRQKLKSEPEEGGAFEPNLSIKRELEV